MTKGEDAERLVEQRVRDALRLEYRVYANVSWTGPTRDGGPAVDGEADLIIAHPEGGVLVLEVKDGIPSRDGQGRWWLGSLLLDPSPFDQARRSMYELVRRLAALPGWPIDPATGRSLEPHAGHGVAFPSVDLASLVRGHALLGPDAPAQTVLDAQALESPAATRAWVERAFDFVVGDGSRGRPLGTVGMRLLDELLAPTVELRRLVRGLIADDRSDLLRASREQRFILDRDRSRRVEVVGPAGSGKSMLAAEKARRLAGEGYRTLLVCFNQRLASTLMRDLADVPAPGGLEVTTFHRLCERLGSTAGVLPARPSPIPQAWWDETLPTALEDAIDALPGERFHAVIVDEGQDFERGWLESLDFLLHEPGEDILWIFHDPGQALYRPDVIGELGLQPLLLHENHRNPASVAALAARFYHGTGEVSVLREEAGVRHRVIAAAPGRDSLETLRKTLHELTEIEQVPPWQIVVLSGGSAADSEAWRTRRFGNVVLWNEAIDDDGRSRGLPPERVPEEPTDVVVFETVRRFKGLEREVVLLVELPEDGARLDELLYVGLTRATTQLVVIAPPALAARLG